MIPDLICFYSDVYITNGRVVQLLNHAENCCEKRLSYQKQLKSISDDFQQLFVTEGKMQLLFDNLNECGRKLVKRLYNGKQLTIEGAPKLVWDWSEVRVRGTSGATGSFSKSYGVTQADFSKRMRTEEDQCRVKPAKVTKAKPPSMRSASLLSPSWEALMSLSNSMKFWSEPGSTSPLKKKSKVERQGRAIKWKQN